MLAKFAQQRNLNIVITSAPTGNACCKWPRWAQTQRIQDKIQSHTALRITEGSMIKHDLNISANFLHIKWPVLNASVSNFSSERENVYLLSISPKNTLTQSSFASVSVDNHILAPLKNLLNGVPKMLRLHRFPTGENGNEEERNSGVPRVSCGPVALKYILLWSKSAQQASKGPLRCCLNTLLSMSTSSARRESLWKAMMDPPRLIWASGTQRKQHNFHNFMCVPERRGRIMPWRLAGLENHSLKYCSAPLCWLSVC